MLYNEVLAKNIFKIISGSGMSERKLLAKLHINSMFLTKLKNKTLISISFIEVYKISQFFGVTLDELVEYKPDPNLKDVIKGDIHKRNTAMMLRGYSSLDAKGRYEVCQQITKEKERIKNERKYKRRKP